MRETRIHVDETRIDIWPLWLRESHDDMAVLGRREVARAQRLRIATKRQQYVAAQTALRRILEFYVGIPAAALRFTYGENGKPQLAPATGVEFNLTHSGELAVVAVGRGGRLGVDVEDRRRGRPFLRLARRYFSTPEYRWLEALPESRQTAGFYRLWVLKEAYLKAVGTGLTFAPNRFTFELDGDLAALTATEMPGDDVTRWSFLEPTLAADYLAAVCYEGSAKCLRLRYL